MILAIIAGWITGSEKEILGIPFIKIYSFIGQLFLHALNLVVVPLVCSSIILGTSRMGKDSSFGFLGIKTFGFYLSTTFLAVLVGLGGFLVLSSGHSIQNIESLSNTINSQSLASLEGDTFDKLTQIFLKIVPSNILAAASQGQMLGLIFFSILFGYFSSKIDPNVSSTILNFWNGVFQIMMKMTQFVMKALPIGVFGLIAKVTATTGFDAISSLGWYFGAVVLSLFIYAFVILPILLKGIANVNPFLFLRAMAPAFFTAFSTSSSAATMPLTMECLETRVGLSNRICSFTIPLGTSLYMSGGALYLCVASLFIAQSYGIELNMTVLSLTVFMSCLTSMGIAGIPSASLISVMIIMQTLGIPSEGVGLIMAVDRILDMFRTTVNVMGNSACAVLLAHSENETNSLSLHSLANVDTVEVS